ncbi:MAG: hypothetical protein ACRDUS_01150 [Mycobacterium sp.]
MEPAYAAPSGNKVACRALDVAQEHSDAIGGEVENMRAALQSFVTGRGKMQLTDNASIAANRDVSDLRADEAAIGTKSFTDAVNALDSAVQDMNQSVKGIYHMTTDDDGFPYVASAIPSPDTYGFVDRAGDMQLAVAAVLSQLRGSGCT